MNQQAYDHLNSGDKVRLNTDLLREDDYRRSYHGNEGLTVVYQEQSAAPGQSGAWWVAAPDGCMFPVTPREIEFLK